MMKEMSITTLWKVAYWQPDGMYSPGQEVYVFVAADAAQSVLNKFFGKEIRRIEKVGNVYV